MSVITFVLDNLPAFLVLWAITSSVMVAAYAFLAAIARAMRGLRPIDPADSPYWPEPYPGCFMCEGARGISIAVMTRHQLDTHGAIRW